MTAFRGTIPDWQLANPLYAGAVVTFYEVDEDGEQTEELATLYAEPTGSQTTSNPQVLDSEGKFLAPVYIVDPVIGEVVGTNVGSHTTGIIAPRGTWKGAWVTATRYYASDFLIQNGAATFKVYIATQDFTSGATFAADLAAGKIELVVQGGDTYYVTIDDPGRPATGETWREIISEPSTLFAGMAGSYAKVVTAAAASTVFSIQKNGVQVGTLSFAIAATSGTFTLASDVSFAAGDVLSIVAPTRDATLAGLHLTIRLLRATD